MHILLLCIGDSDQSKGHTGLGQKRGSGQEGGSVGKGLAVPACGPEFQSLIPEKKPEAVEHNFNGSIRTVKWETDRRTTLTLES